MKTDSKLEKVGMDNYLREYVKKLPNDDAIYLGVRYMRNLCGDRADIANFLSKNHEIDTWLSGANDADEWYNMLDMIGTHVIKDYKKRVGMD